MQAVGADAHDRAHAVVSAAGEPRGGVDQHGGGVHGGGEAPRQLQAGGDDAVRVPGAVFEWTSVNKIQNVVTQLPTDVIFGVLPC